LSLVYSVLHSAPEKSMKSSRKIFVVLAVLLAPFVCDAQCTNGGNACSTGVPHFVKLNGTLRNLAGVSRGTVVAIRFVIYDSSTGGTALWEEVQNTEVDSEGRYEVMLGVTASEGIPIELFTSGDPRWLEVEPLIPNVEAEPRMLLVSVPYALEAADAQTLGGLPPSAFAQAVPLVTAEAAGSGSTSAAEIGSPAGAAPSGSAVDSSGGPINMRRPPNLDIVPKFSRGSSLVDSQIEDSGGVVTMQNLANILFANRFAGGVPEAIKACPANGCIVYAISPDVNLDLGTIDPGTKAVTIYLGPYTYSVKQITLRKAMKIIGMGASASPAGTTTCSAARPCNGTALQSINGNNPVFVVPQDNNDPATHVLLSGFALLGSAGNTNEDGFFLDASSTVNSGLWYSSFEDISVSGFAGTGIHLRGRNNNFSSTDQWLLFNNVTVSRTSGGGSALRLEGAVFELRFRNCEFDGQATGDGTNIYIGGLSAGTGSRGFPLDIVFEGLVSQLAALAVEIDGAVHLTFYDSHHEFLWGAYQVTANTSIATMGLTISNCEFEGTVGNHQGAGYDLNITTTTTTGVVFAHNQIIGNPDTIVKGTNIASVTYEDNLSCETCGGSPLSGITTQVSPAATIDVRGVHSVGLNPSTTPITTIQSSLGPGEMLTLFTLAGPVSLGAGGNIDLMGMSSLTVNGTITLVRSDLGGLLWKVVSQWSPAPR
jgi:hypothetical protein